MAKFKAITGFTNVFADAHGRRYLSGIVHPNAEEAVTRRTKRHLKGTIVGVAQVTWDEPENSSLKPWDRKS